jgi:hypothetical protein
MILESNFIVAIIESMGMLAGGLAKKETEVKNNCSGKMAVMFMPEGFSMVVLMMAVPIESAAKAVRERRKTKMIR